MNFNRLKKDIDLSLSENGIVKNHPSLVIQSYLNKTKLSNKYQQLTLQKTSLKRSAVLKNSMKLYAVGTTVIKTFNLEDNFLDFLNTSDPYALCYFRYNNYILDLSVNNKADWIFESQKFSLSIFSVSQQNLIFYCEYLEII